MDFIKKNNKDNTIFYIQKEILDDNTMQKIIENLNSKKKNALDLSNVRTISSRAFIQYLIEDKYSLYNLNTEVLTYLSLVLKEGFLKSYMNYNDFKNNKRQLIKRNLRLFTL